jgi:hypothetical protein
MALSTYPADTSRAASRRKTNSQIIERTIRSRRRQAERPAVLYKLSSNVDIGHSPLIRDPDPLPIDIRPSSVRERRLTFVLQRAGDARSIPPASRGLNPFPAPFAKAAVEM